MEIAGYISGDPEQYVLGSCLKLGVEAFDRSREKIKNVNYFDVPRHRLIWENLIKVYKKKSVSLDIPLFLANVDDEVVVKMGGGSFLYDLTTPVTTIARLDAHLEIVTKSYMSRRIVVRVNDWAEKARGGTHDPIALLDQMETEIENIRGGLSNNDYEPLSELYPEVIEQTDKCEIGAIKDGVIYAGFSDLDSLTGGFRGGQLIIIAGQTGHGKTELALQICENVAIGQNKKVLFFSIEMSGLELAERTLFSQAGVGYNKRDGAVSLTAEDWSNLHLVKNDNILYNDNPNITAVGIRTVLRQAKKRDGVGLGVVDYLGLIGSDDNYENRQQEVALLSRTMKKIARDLDMPILLLCQLSRQNQYRANKEPQLSDLRESGAIEQDADKVIFVYHYPDKKEGAEQVCRIFLRKNRKGRIGSVPMLFIEGRWRQKLIHEVSKERVA